jgi:hypothetical protein
MSFRDCSLLEVMDFALEVAIDKHDPIRKAQRAKKREERKEKAKPKVQNTQSEVKKNHGMSRDT